jgi:parvulin-like peptidyl-prolyl isomerase
MDRLSERGIHAPYLLEIVSVGSRARRAPGDRWGCQARSLPKGWICGNAALILISFLLLGAPAGAAGPAAPDLKAIVLEAGPIQLTMADLTADFHTAAAADTSTLRPDLPSLHRFLESYIGTVALQAWAMRDSTILLPRDRESLEMNTEMRLGEALRERLLPRYLSMDDATLRAVYDRMETELKLSVIKTATLVDMDSVRAALATGMPFEEVARKYSRDVNTAAVGGALGWIGASRLPVEQQEVLWSLPVGSLSPPLAEPSFHALYRVEARRNGPPRGTFESERPGILRGVAMSQLPKAARDMHDDLMAQYHFKVDPDSAEWMRDFLQRETRTARRTYDPKLDKTYVRFDEPREGPFWKEAPLKGADARRAIATIDGDTLSALEVIDQLVFQPTLVWPRFESVGDVIGLCDDAFFERVVLLEAARLGLAKDPEVERKIMNQKRWVSWRAYRRTKILPSIRPTDAEIQSLYDKRIASYRIPERRRFVVVSVPEAGLASEAARRLEAGDAPSTVARALHRQDLLIAVTPDTGLGLVTYGQTPGFDATIFGLSKGQVSEPLADRSNFAVIRVDDILPARTRSLEEVRGELERELMAPREKQALAALLTEVRPQVAVKVNRVAIDRMDFDAAVFERREKGLPSPGFPMAAPR